MKCGFLKIESLYITSIQNNQTSRASVFKKINQDFSHKVAKIKKMYITSSCELMFLQNDIIAWFFEDIFYQYSKVTFSIISLGCLGFYATLLDFYQSTEQEALVYVIDSPSSELQTMLNAIGIGILNNQDGLVSKEGIAIYHLKKVVLLEDKTSLAFLKGAYVTSIKILALEKKPSSTLSLINRFAQHILDIKTPASRCVSFQINSGWSASLMRYLSLLKETKHLLPSLEQDHFHLHALKPLYEFEHYFTYIKNEDLINILNILYRPTVGRSSASASCYEPRHAIAFYDANNTVLNTAAGTTKLAFRRKEK